MNGPTPLPDGPLLFPTHFDAIMQRINEIDPVQYGNSRNFTDGAVTYLSPYISRGVISVRMVQEYILQQGHAPKTIQKFLQELAWREYFQRIWQVKDEAMFTDIKQPQTELIHHQMITAVANATTGINVIDQQIQQYYQTGYMHNHVRMYVASITCNMGRAHWSTPAQWMYYHLLDGDLASNTCSWQWVAGTFSSKKYYCNQENINLFTHTNQVQTFLDQAVENLPYQPLPDVLRSTINLKLSTTLPDVPRPQIDVRLPTLIYNSYNLDPHWRKNQDANRILLLEPSHFQRFPVSEKVLAFIIRLAGNIPGCQLMIGEVSELKAVYKNSESGENGLVSKEHPAFNYYPGIKEERDWIYPEVKGYFNSFFSFWKKCNRLK